MSLKITGIVLGAMLLFFVLVGAPWYVVQPGERGVVVTLGKMDNESIPSGFGLKLPWTRVYHISTKNDIKEDNTECFTSDTQVVKVKYTIIFAIPDVKVSSIYRDYNCDVFKSLIVPRMQEILKQLTSIHRADQIVKKRDDIKVEAIVRLRKAVGELITITDVNVTNIDFTQALEQAIEMKTVMEQQSIAAQYGVEKARQEAEARIIQATAEAKAIQVQSEALKQSESMIYLEAVKKWNGVSPQTLMIGGSSATPVIPVDRKNTH